MNSWCRLRQQQLSNIVWNLNIALPQVTMLRICCIDHGSNARLDADCDWRSHIKPRIFWVPDALQFANDAHQLKNDTKYSWRWKWGRYGEIQLHCLVETFDRQAMEELIYHKYMSFTEGLYRLSVQTSPFWDCAHSPHLAHHIETRLITLLNHPNAPNSLAKGWPLPVESLIIADYWTVV